MENPDLKYIARTMKEQVDGERKQGEYVKIKRATVILTLDHWDMVLELLEKAGGPKPTDVIEAWDAVDQSAKELGKMIGRTVLYCPFCGQCGCYCRRIAKVETGVGNG